MMAKKRTNPFQRLVTHIYEQLKVEGQSIEESVRLKEGEINGHREVDILLTQQLLGGTYRIAIECRGRLRDQDVEWIDGLMGKYKYLGVDKIIAVSSSGFTQLALDKAVLEGIETLTVQQATRKDWAREFVKIGMSRCAQFFKPGKISVFTEPQGTYALRPDSMIWSESDVPLISIQDLCRKDYEKNKAEFMRTMQEAIVTRFSKQERFKDDMGPSWMDIHPAVNVYLKNEASERFRILRFRIHVVVSVDLEPLEMQHFVLGDALASVATTVDEDGKPDEQITIVQVASKPGVATMSRDSFRPAKKESRKKQGSPTKSKRKK